MPPNKYQKKITATQAQINTPPTNKSKKSSNQILPYHQQLQYQD